MKKCVVCEIQKELNCFNKNASKKDKLQRLCKDCDNKRSKQYYKKHKEEKTFYNQEYYKINQERLASSNKEYRQNNKEKISKQKKEYGLLHKKEKSLYDKKYSKKYRKINKERILARAAKYYKDNKEKIKNRIKNRLQKFPLLRIIHNRRSRRSMVLKFKLTSTKEDLGCTTEEWFQYLESKFNENMNWNNYGSYWVLDEIIPVSAWNQGNRIEQKACWHYLNSQPLEKTENLKKGGANRKDYAQDKEDFLKFLEELNNAQF